MKQLLIIFSLVLSTNLIAYEKYENEYVMATIREIGMMEMAASITFMPKDGYNTIKACLQRIHQYKKDSEMTCDQSLEYMTLRCSKNVCIKSFKEFSHSGETFVLRMSLSNKEGKVLKIPATLKVEVIGD